MHTNIRSKPSLSFSLSTFFIVNNLTRFSMFSNKINNNYIIKRINILSSLLFLRCRLFILSIITINITSSCSLNEQIIRHVVINNLILYVPTTTCTCTITSTTCTRQPLKQTSNMLLITILNY